MTDSDITIGDIADWLEENYPGSHIAEDARILASEPGDLIEARGDTWRFLDVPVLNGVATLPDGRTVTSTANIVRVPMLVPSEVVSE